MTLSDKNDLTVGGAASGDETLAAGGALTFNDTVVGGNLDASAKGAIGQAAAPAAVVVGGTSKLTADNAGAKQDITLANAANDFVGAVTVDGRGVTLSDKNDLTVGGAASGDATLTAAGSLTFNALTVGGNLNATATTGDITDNGPISIAGDTTLWVDGTHSIILDNDNTFSGSVIVPGNFKNLTLKDSTALSLASFTLSGNLNLTAAGISQSGSWTVNGMTTLAAGANDITLNNAGNDFVGKVNASGMNVSLVDKNSIQLGGVAVNGALGVEAKSGDITQSSAPDKVTVGGVTTLKATGNITLDNAANDFIGVVNADGANVTLADANDITLKLIQALSAVSIQAGGNIIDAESDEITVDAHGFAHTDNVSFNIIANNVTLMAGGNIGTTTDDGMKSFNALDVQAVKVDAQGANVAIYGKGDLTIGQIKATAGGGVVNLVADHSIIDGNDDTVNITGGSLIISASHIIGQGENDKSIDPLEVSLNGGHAKYDIWVNNVANPEDTDKTVYAFFNTIGGSGAPTAAATAGSGALIFINGQYVGGDPKYVNLFAASEAFTEETPELKSRQGVFGQPFFLHDQMDINESVALGLIDFILAQKAAITGSEELPAEAYTEIVTGGLSPTSSIRFGVKKNQGGKTNSTQPPKEKGDQAGASKTAPIQLSAR